MQFALVLPLIQRIFHVQPFSPQKYSVCEWHPFFCSITWLSVVTWQLMATKWRTVQTATLSLTEKLTTKFSIDNKLPGCDKIAKEISRPYGSAKYHDSLQEFWGRSSSASYLGGKRKEIIWASTFLHRRNRDTRALQRYFKTPWPPPPPLPWSRANVAQSFCMNTKIYTGWIVQDFLYLT